jgi:two-component system NtrC family response regulator
MKNEFPKVGSMTLEEVEIKMVKRALEFHEQNISQAAKALGITRNALYRRMEKYGI